MTFLAAGGLPEGDRGRHRRLGLAIGPWASILGSVFFLLALLTTYWSISYALGTIVRERLSVGRVPAWLLATLPNIALALSGLTGFMGFVRLAGGAIALLVALLFVPGIPFPTSAGEPVLPGLIDGHMHFLPSAALVERAARAGFQVTAHAIGTRAIEVLLSAYESLPAGLAVAAEDTASTTSSFRLRTRWSARCAWDSP